MPWRDVPLADTVKVGGTGIGGGDGTGYIYGSPPIWRDNSDASYASIAGRYFGDGQPAFYGYAAVNPAAGSIRGQVTAVRIRARLRAEIGAAPRVPRFRIQYSGGTFTEIPTDLCPASPTWVTREMTTMTADAMALLANNPSGWTLSMLPPSYTSPVPNELQRFAIYEVRLEVKVRGVAPPCRIYPREDGLGVGSGRAVPPPKSQQLSPGRRGVGYY